MYGLLFSLTGPQKKKKRHATQHSERLVVVCMDLCVYVWCMVCVCVCVCVCYTGKGNGCLLVQL